MSKRSSVSRFLRVERVSQVPRRFGGDDAVERALGILLTRLVIDNENENENDLPPDGIASVVVVAEPARPDPEPANTTSLPPCRWR